MLIIAVVLVLCATSTLQTQSQPKRGPRGLYLSPYRPQGPRVRHEIRGNTSTIPEYYGRESCDLRELEYRLSDRLTKLEVQMSEKSDNVRWELREGSRRLQALEWQSAEVETALVSIRNELERFTETNEPYPFTPDKLDLRVDNLAKGIQLVVAALRSINSDIAAIKRNVSTLVRDTRSLVHNHDELVTIPFLRESLTDVKHHVYQHPPRTRSRESPPRNCKEVQERGYNVSGIYRIQPELAPRAFMVLCDMNTKGGGWTYIHNRYEGVQDFYLNWHSYKTGFGNLGGEFWLGLEYLHQLTGYEVNELLVEMVDVEKTKTEAFYSAFSIGTELEGYALKVLAGYEGDAGDSLMYHAGSKFSTKDMDQDSWPEGNCASAHTGAWWYKSCDMSNLNGRYLKGELPEDYTYQGMYWGEFHGARYSLLQARMMVRPRDENSRSFYPEEE